MSALTFTESKGQAADAKRRIWSEEERDLVVRASLKSGTSVNAVAKLYGVQPWQIYDWRKKAREGAQQNKAAALIPVHVTETHDAEKVSPKQGCSLVIEAKSMRITITGLIEANVIQVVLECLAR